MQELNIPKDHYSKFKAYFSLSSTVKQKIGAQLESAPIGVSPAQLINSISNQITELPKERIAEIVQIYFSLIRARDNANIDIPNFLEILKNALIKTRISEIQPSPEIIEDLRRLLSNTDNMLITAKAMELMAKNQKIFMEAEINQDIRPVFDKKDILLSSVIIHNLKLVYEEDNEDKEIYLSLNDNDLETIISILKKAQDRLKLIKSQFANAKILKIT